MLIEQILYEDINQANDAIRLLNRIFTQRTQFMILTSKIQVIYDDVINQILKRTNDILVILKSDAENFDLWLGKNDSLSTTKAFRVV